MRVNGWFEPRIAAPLPGEAGRFLVVFLVSSVDLGTATHFAPVPPGLASSRFGHTVAKHANSSCLVSPHPIGFLPLDVPLERAADELIDL